MDVAGSSVGIVGGSIAGCAAAVALERLGAEVDVYERSSGELRDRGSGIAIPLALRDELIAEGYLPTSYPSCVPAARWWVHHDGSADGRVLWDQPSAGAMSNWGVLWRGLRADVDDDRYHDGSTIAGLTETGDGIELSFADGTTREFDAVTGADGYKSIIRGRLHPDAVPEYAGYVLWRGNFPESRLADRRAIDRLDEAQAWLTVCFDGGHGVMYPIPDFDDGAEPGGRRVNWAIYAAQPPGLDFVEPTSVPPGAVTPEVYAELERLLDAAFPPMYRTLFDSPIEEVSIQPIYDQQVDAYTSGRIALIGDAGTVTRPHTGSGATKAIQDALTLSRLGAEHGDWSGLLLAYDAERTTTGRSLVDLGRRIGRDQVEHTPPWAEMAPADFDAWTAATLSGESLYFYGDREEN